MTNTEKLLICAKAVGFNAMLTDIPGRGIAVRYKDPDAEVSWVDYNPLINDAQAFELLRWLFSGHKRSEPKHYQLMRLIQEATDKEQIDNEAIVNAVVAMEEGE